ncbi:hypothetical protein KCP73_01020 [Salmonella enterica subsp. enterica]|nr:hypothetical protein KCP73_01020 [Salmonella enterica subsp. enterica]
MCALCTSRLKVSMSRFEELLPATVVMGGFTTAQLWDGAAALLPQLCVLCLSLRPIRRFESGRRG